MSRNRPRGSLTTSSSFAARLVATPRWLAQFSIALFLALLTATGVFFGVREWQRPVEVPEWSGEFAGLTYNAFRPGQGPAQNKFPSEAEVREDMKLMSQVTGRIRTYSSSETPNLVALAAEQDLKVMAGAWLKGDPIADQVELRALADNAKRYRNVERLIVGNEVLLREDMPQEQLVAYLRQVRKATRRPVSTAEPWGTWLAHPELAREVDFIAVHLLPYWDQVKPEESVQFALAKLAELREAFPNKRIVIAETGWPSYGQRIHGEPTNAQSQSRYLRQFGQAATEQKLDYYIIEAFDQPWKAAEEGRPGPYWGVFNADRRLKLTGTGTLWRMQQWQTNVQRAFLWLTPAVLLLLLAVRHWRLYARALLAASAYFAMAYLCLTPHWNDGVYLPQWARLSQPALLLSSAICLVMLALEVFEALDVTGAKRRLRPFGPLPFVPERRHPLVSVHLACANESPQMVLLTLESLKRLDWPALEVVVVDNNTKDEALWHPVRDWVAAQAAHGWQFKFAHLPHCPGFKAEALNHALELTDPAAQVIAVVDADYEVEANWLRDLVAHFDAPKVTIVQAPQAHRAFADKRFKRWVNWEFEGFFRIGMHHRNERNAIIQHGTMTMVRASALREVGGWSTWTICEDSELGLRLLLRGDESVYVDQVYGRGLTPATLKSWKNQRIRWAQGAMQILKHHALALVRPGPMTLGQRFHFLTGWMPWMGQAVQLVTVLGSLVWVSAMLLSPRNFEAPLPEALFLVYLTPVLRTALGISLYRLRVRCSWADTLGAALASAAISHAIAIGILKGLFTQRGTFVVTAKARPVGRAPSGIGQERALLAALLAAAVACLWQGDWNFGEPAVWALALVSMALPYAAMVAFKQVEQADARGEEPTTGAPAVQRAPAVEAS